NSIGQEYLPRRTRPDGALQLFVVDPDGHHIELFTGP
ncbi:MAG: glyoxalase, partial [Verrucomicrobia bacterium]|nr:glyoxalase [Verrucomicrobiota bacterium]